MSELTGLFALAGNGDAQAFDRIFTLLYLSLIHISEPTRPY